MITMWINKLRLRQMAIALGVLCSMTLWTQEPSRLLDLDACLKRAKEWSVELNTSRLEVERAQVQLESMRSTFLPTLSARADQTIELGRSSDKQGVMQDRSSLGLSFGVNAQVTLFEGFKRKHDLRSARFTLESGRYQHEHAHLEMEAQVVQLYYALVNAERLVEVALVDVERYEQSQAHAQALTQGGKWSVDKLAEANSLLARSQMQLVEAEQQAELARHDLRTALGLSREVTFVRPEGIERELERMSMKMSQIADTANTRIHLQALPRLKAGALTLEASREQIASARSGYWPTLSLTAGYMSSYHHLLDRQYQAFQLPWSKQISENGRAYVGLGVSIPIFDAYRTRNQIRQAKIDYQVQSWRQEGELRRLSRELESARLAVRLAWTKIETARTNLGVQRTSQVLAQELWQVGRSTATELAEANQRMLSAEIDLLNAQHDYVVRARLLALYLGESSR